MVNVLDEKGTKTPTSETPGLAKWLEQRCHDEGLSYRQAAAKTGVSHATIATIRKGIRPSADTIVKLARAFSEGGQHQTAILEDYLLVLCGYRSHQQEAEFSEPLARLLDKLMKCDEKELELIEYFVDFSATLGNGHKSWKGRSH